VQHQPPHQMTKCSGSENNVKHTTTTLHNAVTARKKLCTSI